MTPRALLLTILLAAAPSGAALAQAVTAVQAPGAVLRWLDKVSGQTGDLELSRGQSATAGRLTISLNECRYPSGGEESDAYAHVTITDRLVTDRAVFSGWMLSSSPALSALDHSRYDVWVLRCLERAG